ncbi:HAD-IC family P-type ATPase [Candidatus Saccharibacteria bacterium]|nr:HAD-IC family P-type ATPase [Candidatus Saccharibacteria bacterium]
MWHTKTPEWVCEELKTSEKGLDLLEVKKRLERDGQNVLPRGKRQGLIKIFLMQFINPIVAILIVAIILALITEEYVNAVFIFVVIMINGILGTVQEYTAGKSAEKLQEMIKVTVKVLRDGERMLIDARDLVIGDVVILESGDKIPADMRLMKIENLMMDESILTGESEGVEKSVRVLDEGVNVSDRNNMVYAGTMVLSGRGIGIVVETAEKTEIGKIADKVMNTKEADSPLVIRIKKFSRQLSTAFLVFVIIMSLILYYKGYVAREIFFTVVALTVSAIPEGMMTAMTIALSVASHRMAKKNVIVKKLNAVESLGSCTVIASDKTGTLTVNEQTGKVVMLPGGEDYYVKGAGYEVDEKYNFWEEVRVEHREQLRLIAELGMLNNEAELKYENQKWSGVGDSIDVAFLVLGEKLKCNIKKDDVILRIPYESRKKYSAVYYEDKRKNQKFFTAKGSTEKILQFCDKMLVNGIEKKIDEIKIKEQNDRLAKDGYRIIALAYGKKDALESKVSYDENDLPKMTFVGLVGFVDPIREDAVEAVKFCRDAGVKVYMITGDHPLTAYYVGERLGMVSDYGEVATGDEIEKKLKLGEEAFDRFIRNVRVCARTTPMQKLEIVEALKRQEEFVAVTGDGVNDAPALKTANIGVAMGSGSDVAKETGDMIIADDNFATIVTGVREGRKAYKNIRNVIYLLLSTGLAEIILFVISVFAGLPMPLTAVQLLWLNLITNGIQDNMLAFEKNSIGLMKEKVRGTREGIVDRLLLSETFVAAMTIAVVGFILYNYLYNVLGLDLELARTYLLVAMVFMENIHIFNCRSEKVSLFKIKVRDNKLVVLALTMMIILQIMIVSVPGVGAIFGLDRIPLVHTLELLLLAVPVLVAMEIFKLVLNKIIKARNGKN